MPTQTLRCRGSRPRADSGSPNRDSKEYKERASHGLGVSSSPANSRDSTKTSTRIAATSSAGDGGRRTTTGGGTPQRGLFGRSAWTVGSGVSTVSGCRRSVDFCILVNPLRPHLSSSEGTGRQSVALLYRHPTGHGGPTRQPSWVAAQTPRRGTAVRPGSLCGRHWPHGSDYREQGPGAGPDTSRGRGRGRGRRPPASANVSNDGERTGVWCQVHKLLSPPQVPALGDRVRRPPSTPQVQ